MSDVCDFDVYEIVVEMLLPSGFLPEEFALKTTNLHPIQIYLLNRALPRSGELDERASFMRGTMVGALLLLPLEAGR